MRQTASGGWSPSYLPMKLLFDENLSAKLCRQLKELFPGSTQVKLIGLEQADDKAIWEYAKLGGFAIVTQDADFAEMRGLYGQPPQVIWLKCGNQEAACIEKLLRRSSTRIQKFADDPTRDCLEIY